MVSQTSELPLPTLKSARIPPELWIAIIALGVVISVNVVPGVFIVDDNNYLINILNLRQGRVTVANTQHLTPSAELLSFDPGPWTRKVASTPVASTAPPLYAPLALPFSFFGWRGLVALNTLAYLATIIAVFVHARRYATEPLTPWLAAAAFGLGGYVIEYAQGLWPQALSLGLCAAGVFAAGRCLDGKVHLAAVSGFLLALATGVRYQNTVILGSVALAIALWSSARRKTLPAFLVAALVPLATSAAINHARLDSWNPISKGKGYLVPQFAQDASTPALDPVVALWARVVDASSQPKLTDPSVASWLDYDEQTGAHVMRGVTKKSLLQSAPWAVLSLAMFCLCWLPARSVDPARQRQLRLLSLIAFSLFAVLALAGTQRHEGFAFNQRYLLELLPFAAVAFAWATDGLNLRVRPIALGAALGLALVLSILLATAHSTTPTGSLFVARQLALLKVPLVLSLSLAILWWLSTSHVRLRNWTAGAVGFCLAWGFTLHLADDVAGSRRVKRANLRLTQALAEVLPDHSAYVAFWWMKDAAVPLLFDRDIVILDPNADDGETALC